MMDRGYSGATQERGSLGSRAERTVQIAFGNECRYRSSSEEEEEEEWG